VNVSFYNCEPCKSFLGFWELMKPNFIVVFLLKKLMVDMRSRNYHEYQRIGVIRDARSFMAKLNTKVVS